MELIFSKIMPRNVEKGYLISLINIILSFLKINAGKNAEEAFGFF
jgi:hypothetical protein